MSRNYHDGPGGHESSLLSSNGGVVVWGTNGRRFVKRRDIRAKRREAYRIIDEALKVLDEEQLIKEELLLEASFYEDAFYEEFLQQECEHEDVYIDDYYLYCI